MAANCLPRAAQLTDNHDNSSNCPLNLAAFQQHIHSIGRPLLLDGALATELEKRGADLNHPLWSAKALREDPDSIVAVHRDYYLAGADVAITASYQASTRGLREHLGLSEDEAKAVIRRSVELAQQARDEAPGGGVSRKLLVAGSVGPYGAYLADGSEYTGNYDLSIEELQAFHRPRIEALVDAGVDLLAVETIPNAREIKAILSLLEAEFPETLAWLSCTLAADNATALPDGTHFSELATLLRGRSRNIVAVGVNCVPPAQVGPALDELFGRLELGSLVCYPNSGEVWDGTRKVWKDQLDPQQGLVENLEKWRKHALFMGGCCRTGPKDIKALFEAQGSSG